MNCTDVGSCQTGFFDYDIRQIQQRQKGIVDVEGRGIEKRLKPIAPNLEEIKIQLWTDL